MLQDVLMAQVTGRYHRRICGQRRAAKSAAQSQYWTLSSPMLLPIIFVPSLLGYQLEAHKSCVTIKNRKHTYRPSPLSITGI